MKNQVLKFCISAFLIITACSFPLFTSVDEHCFAAEKHSLDNSASYGYARIATDNVYFYCESSSYDLSALFEIPVGYYVKILEEKQELFLCEYAKSERGFTKLIGFVKKDEVILCDEAENPLFPEVTATTLTVSNLYESPSFSSKTVLATYKGQTAYLYGYSLSGAYVYAKIGNDFGYLILQNLDFTAFPTHPQPITLPSSSPSAVEPEQYEPESKYNSKSGLITVFTVAISIPLLFIIYLLFAKPKGPKSGSVSRLYP